MTLVGKGFFIWKIRDCENGDATAIANLAQQAGFTHVVIKIADGTGSYNVDITSGTDLVPPVAQALRARGIQVWGWHYVYGNDPLGEADKAIQRVRQLGVDGYVIDAEAEYTDTGKEKAAAQFMSRLRASLPTLSVALCSYRYPSLHPQLPWRVFLEKCNLNMPQVYWMQAHNPADQLIRCVHEFQALVPFRPVVPVGAAFTERNWSPSASEVISFLQTAQILNLSASNFWEWANCRRNLPDVWEAIKNYNWAAGPQDVSQLYIMALNSQDVNQVLNLYNADAVHVSATRTIQGLEALRGWYTSLFRQILPNGRYLLTSFSGSGSSRHFTWTATSNAGSVNNGNDTFALVNDRIAYHYTSFTVA